MTFEELLEQITPALKAQAKRLNGHFSFFDDNDLFQEAVMHLWDHYNKGMLKDKNTSYILKCSYFHLKNYLRKNYKKIAVLSLDEKIDEGQITLKDTLQDEKDYFGELVDRLSVEEIQNNGLSGQQKNVFNLWLEGFTTREIGNRLGISHVRIVKIQAEIRKKILKDRLPK